MKVQISRVHFPVTTLGPGKRIGIWFQGCSIGCPGCISRDTWEPDPDKAINVEEVLQWCQSSAEAGFDGITITGGEPFEQPEALERLVDMLVNWRSSESLAFDILCFSGLPMRRLSKRFQGVADKLDAIVAGPYVEALAPGGLWRGSSNQKIMPTSELGIARYSAESELEQDNEPRLQFSVDDDRIWYIGIPGPDDMERLREAMDKRGIRQSAVSWLL